MIFSYYPGCTLKNKAQDLDRYARASAEALGVTLQELENWQCCGGAYLHGQGRDRFQTGLRARAQRRQGAGPGLW